VFFGIPDFKKTNPNQTIHIEFLSFGSVMKKVILSTISFVVLGATSALSADLPSIETAAVASPVPMWTGFYAGLNAGGTWSASNSVQIQEYPVFYHPAIRSAPEFGFDTEVDSSISTRTNSSSGFIGGGQVGYNEQLQNNFIVGVETDIQGIASNNGNPWVTTLHNTFSYYSYSFNRINTVPVDTIYSFSKSLDYIGTVRGRLGYLLTPNLLVYSTAGLSYGGTTLHTYSLQQVNSGLSDEFGPGKSSDSRTRVGWTAGGGLEWMFLNNWSTKVEYLYYDLGSPSIYMGQNTIVWNGSVPVSGISAGQISSAQGFNAQTHFNGNIVRAGVNYHFNFASAPVVANF
jgi:outer membrane immunogenic protein